MDTRDRARMRKALFETVQNQIDRGKPEEAQKAYARLLVAGCTREQALRLIAEVLLTGMNTAMRTKQPFDEAAYEDALRALPGAP